MGLGLSLAFGFPFSPAKMISVVLSDEMRIVTGTLKMEHAVDASKTTFCI